MLPSFGGTTKLFAFLCLGKLVIFIVQTAGLLEPVWSILRALETWCKGIFAFWPPEHELVKEFRECGLCIGAWVFTALAICGRINLIDFIDNGIISYILTGFVSSFIVHLLSGGWKYHFEAP